MEIGTLCVLLSCVNESVCRAVSSHYAVGLVHDDFVLYPVLVFTTARGTSDVAIIGVFRVPTGLLVGPV